MRATAEPRWVKKILRLFPHPIFAAAVSMACFLVTIIFTGVAIARGQGVFAVGAVMFGAVAYLIISALMVRRRRSRLVEQRPDVHAPLRRSSTMSDRVPLNGLTSQPSGRPDPLNQDDELRGLPPVRTSNLLLYLSTVIVWEVQVADFLLRLLAGIQPAAIWRHSLLGINILVTLLAVWFGRRDIQRLRNSGGKVELTGIQTAIVAAILVSLGITVVVIYETVKDNL